MRYSLERQNANEDEAKVVEILVEDGEEVNAGSIIMVLETSKAAVEIISNEAGPVTLVVAVGDTVPIGTTLAYQNETPKQKKTNKISDKIKVSAKALLLMETHGLTIEDLDKSGFIRESDVLKVVNADFHTADEKISETSPLDGYDVPPVAYFNFAYDIDLDPAKDHEVEFWNLHVKNLCKKLDTTFAHNIVNKEGNLQPYECDIRLQVTRNDLTKSTINVFRGKKSKQRVDICVSYLKSSLNFNHVALLYPGSKITVAVAECVGINKINVSICYDHRFLNGYEIMKIVEACHD